MSADETAATARFTPGIGARWRRLDAGFIGHGHSRKDEVMSKTPDQQAADLMLAFEFHEFGVAMMRENLRRQYPSESDQRIAERLLAWLRTRPGAEHGDAQEQPVELATCPR